MNINVTSSIEIDMEPEELIQLANAFQHAKQHAQSGHILRAQVTPTIAFRYTVPEKKPPIYSKPEVPAK